MNILTTCKMESGEVRRVIEAAGYYFLQSGVAGCAPYNLPLASKAEADQAVKELNEYKEKHNATV